LPLGPIARGGGFQSSSTVAAAKADKRDEENDCRPESVPLAERDLPALVACGEGR
jgi:hypothetical protein